MLKVEASLVEKPLSARRFMGDEHCSRSLLSETVDCLVSDTEGGETLLAGLCDYISLRPHLVISPLRGIKLKGTLTPVLD